jgi:hypothetical protein
MIPYQTKAILLGGSSSDELLKKTRRLQYFAAAIDLILNCRNSPVSKENPNAPAEILHRFYGLTQEKYLFCVQIKEIKSTGKKFLMSIFPPA